MSYDDFPWLAVPGIGFGQQLRQLKQYKPAAEIYRTQSEQESVTI
jgi:hypothetical protein